ncbi:MAG: HNH endonuclease [Phycisphaerae bacterium]|nr:HNH endonuclease [Phycisphaerae bacterium]
MPHHHSKDDRKRSSHERGAKQSRQTSPNPQPPEDAPILDIDGDIDLATLASAGGRFNLGGAAGVGGVGGVLAAEGLNAKVLVLNKLYVAVRVVSARRAFCLLSRNIAEVIHVESGNEGPKYVNYDFESWTDVAALRTRFEHAEHDWVRTVRFEIAVPRIIRLLGYDRLPEQTVKLNRRNLFARDRNTCQYCGRHFPTADLSLDHVKPRMQGGADSWENLVCACIKCNAKKGGRTPDEARMKLIKKPERPKRNPLIALRLGHEKYASWKTFLDNAYWSVELR